MSALRLGVVIAVAAVSLVVLPESAEAVNFPVARCNGGGCDGWFRSSVSVSWQYDPGGTPSGCGTQTISNDTDQGGASLSCSVSYAGGTVSSSVTVRKDSSPPTVSASPARGPDSNGWYTSPVAFSFTGDDGASGVASCTSGTYGGPDGAAASVTGSCTDNAGNTGSVTLTIKYDASPPTVLGVPARKPDANGWYNHPVAVEFRGNDAGSGISECSPTVTYKGPAADPARLVGQCRDAAGHLSAPTTVELRYDATPPAPPNVQFTNRGSSNLLAWTAGKDVVSVKIRRAPGPGGKKSAIVYTGRGKRFVDLRITSGKRYWYEISLYDVAGNRATKTVGLRPSLGIFSPADGAVVRKPPLVAWSPVAEARFYNLQLWRGNVKLLTTWVQVSKLQLAPRWTSSGVRHALGNGRYRLYVWPAFGTRRDPRYGKLLGQVDFVVKRR